MFRAFLLLQQLLLLICITANALLIRPATSSDVFAARKILFSEAMNPLSISEQTLLVGASDDEDMMLGFGQIRPLDAAYSELASLYVLPEHRAQGIGSAIVEQLLERHDAAANSPTTADVCLLTLKPTMSFYEKHGFEAAPPDDLPSALQFEFKAGSLVSTFLGNDIVCMVRRHH